MDVSAKLNSTNYVNTTNDVYKTSQKSATTTTETQPQNTGNVNDSVDISAKTETKTTGTYNSIGKLNAGDGKAVSKYDEENKAVDARWARASSNNYSAKKVTETEQSSNAGNISVTVKNGAESTTVTVAAGAEKTQSAENTASTAGTAKTAETTTNTAEAKTAITAENKAALKYADMMKATDARWERANSNNKTPAAEKTSETTQANASGVTVNVTVGGASEENGTTKAEQAAKEQAKQAQEIFKQLQSIYKQNNNANFINYLG